jgi:hypothetical protein
MIIAPAERVLRIHPHGGEIPALIIGKNQDDVGRLLGLRQSA